MGHLPGISLDFDVRSKGQLGSTRVYVSGVQVVEACHIYLLRQSLLVDIPFRVVRLELNVILMYVRWGSLHSGATHCMPPVPPTY